MAKMKGLGKGLDALLGDEFTNEPEVKSSLFLPIATCGELRRPAPEAV